MDLRSFSQQNEGCTYELGQILNLVDLQRVIFVIDRTTDRQYLEDTLQRLWHSVAAQSPNYFILQPAVRLFLAERQSVSELGTLLQLLLSEPRVAQAACHPASKQ